MSQVTYQYAIDESGLRVHISDIEPATHRGRIFKCISCGRDLIAKIGNHEKAHSRAPHFDRYDLGKFYSQHLQQSDLAVCIQHHGNLERYLLTIQI